LLPNVNFPLAEELSEAKESRRYTWLRSILDSSYLCVRILTSNLLLPTYLNTKELMSLSMMPIS